MRRRYRDITVFNLSMLDVIASAMGAFLIIMVVIIPYFNKESQQLIRENQSLRQQIQQMQQQIQSQQQVIEQQRQQNARLEREVQSLRDRLSKTFLIIMISWKTARHDVDLHVVDPAGHEFWYKKKSYPGVPGELSEDDKFGPGREVWIITKAPPGDYKVYYRLYSKRGNSSSAVVRGMVYHRDGYDHLPKKILSRAKEKVLVAIITVHNDGRVTIR